ncbi:MAG TPA: amidophosphoribosyltransferase [Candidatus Brocadiia bacterium]|nr:amidophosphoribosyltransferase [Candidatus Brocadiia bacterium]
MGGFFGIASKQDCIADLFYGTDYHSHLGTKRGGLAALGERGFTRVIHNIENAQFRSKFEDDLPRMRGNTGIGVISDTDDQPLIIGSHLGTYAIVTVGIVKNIQELANAAFRNRTTHFCEMSQGELNQTELVATLINKGATFEEGIALAQNTIKGSCSMMLLTDRGVYTARDKLGRTPVIIGRCAGAFVATMETCAFPNLDIETVRDLGPGEIVLITPEGVEQRKSPGNRMQICSFLWVYYGYPSSAYEGIGVEPCRNRCGAALARNDNVEVDIVAGIPDSGTAHAIGYARESGVPYRRPFVKYTPTWPRSFMPQDQRIRDLVARMKLTPVSELIKGSRILFCEDSIVRGTQLRNTVQRLKYFGAKEVHMRPACPPLVHGCQFLNFSRSRSELDLAGRRAIHAIEGSHDNVPQEYTDCSTKKFAEMVEWIRSELGLTTLKYQRLEDLVEAIGLPKERLCTHCWDGSSFF